MTTKKGITVWVVTDPTLVSTDGDCIFSTDAAGMVLQVRGGLGLEDHPAFYLSQADAHADLCERRAEMVKDREEAAMRRVRGAS